MGLKQRLISKLESWDAKYSDGKSKSKCIKYNLADIFDPVDD